MHRVHWDLDNALWCDLIYCATSDGWRAIVLTTQIVLRINPELIAVNKNFAIFLDKVLYWVQKSDTCLSMHHLLGLRRCAAARLIALYCSVLYILLTVLVFCVREISLNFITWDLNFFASVDLMYGTFVQPWYCCTIITMLHAQIRQHG